MGLLDEYYLPGLHVQEHAIDVPLDWTGHVPGQGFNGPSTTLFYRVVDAPEKIHAELPLLIFLQGGPGGAGPRPLSPQSDGWIAEAIKHFRVVLPDQRGTGRSARVDSNTIGAMDAAEGAHYLKHFLADSIVHDFEHLRRTQFAGSRWVSLGQSYGGFLTLTYLSLFPDALTASFTTGGIPHVPADATEVYEHTFPRMERKTEQFYARYPQDRARLAVLADRLSADPLPLPNGDPLTVERLQTIVVRHEAELRARALAARRGVRRRRRQRLGELADQRRVLAWRGVGHRVASVVLAAAGVHLRQRRA